MQNYKQSSSPALIERIIAALSYLTMGTVGFIWLILAFFTKSALRPFLKYHIFQSIFISIIYFLICAFVGLIMNILSVIPFIGSLTMQIMIYLNMPLLLGFSLIELVITAFVFYLVWTSFIGQYSYIPWVSNIIKINTGD